MIDYRLAAGKTRLLKHSEVTVLRDKFADLLDTTADLLAALKASLQPNALNCGFGGQADDPDVCCCGKPKAYHWKAMARDAIAKAEEKS